MKDLSPKMAQFCWQYASIESDTYNFKAKSAEAAGYKTPANSATELLKKPKIQERIQEIYEANVSKHLPSLLSKAAYVFNLSLKADDRTNANTAVKLLLQACGFLRDSGLIEAKEEKQELSEEQQKEFERYLSWKREQLLGDALIKDSIEEGDNSNKQ